MTVSISLLSLSLAVIVIIAAHQIITALRRKRARSPINNFEATLHDLYDLGGFLSTELKAAPAAAEYCTRARGVLVNSRLGLSNRETVSLVCRYTEGLIDGLHMLPSDLGVENTNAEFQKGISQAIYSTVYLVGRRHGTIIRESNSSTSFANPSQTVSELSGPLLH